MRLLYSSKKPFNRKRGFFKYKYRVNDDNVKLFVVDRGDDGRLLKYFDIVLEMNLEILFLKSFKILVSHMECI